MWALIGLLMLMITNTHTANEDYDPLKDSYVKYLLLDAPISTPSSSPGILPPQFTPIPQLEKDTIIIPPSSKSKSDKKTHTPHIQKNSKAQKTSSKTFQCPHCVKTFKWACLLNRHMPAHTGAIFFKCRLYSKKCSEKHNVVIHLKCKAHQKTLQTALQIRGYNTQKDLQAAFKDNKLLANLFVIDLKKTQIGAGDRI